MYRAFCDVFFWVRFFLQLGALCFSDLDEQLAMYFCIYTDIYLFLKDDLIEI